ncbi:hypothetical protein BD408DRAFT_422118 [Parasitella parasitica]|nr:hypothetical protein BD408DRAFT_422118 [Parasitella parasitica]
MSHVACWKKIPFEIALQIFQYATEDVDYDRKKQSLANCQLVCKSWSKSAQKLLYSEIILGQSHHMKFMKTIENNPSIGSLVKKVKISESIVFDVPRYFTYFESNCLNIEEIIAEGQAEKPELYCHLLLTDRFKNLKRIDENLQNQKALLTYPFVVFKYKDTLTEIHLDCDFYLGDYDSKETLVSRLPLFKSLNRIIISLLHNTKDTDPVIDIVPKTVSAIEFLHTQQDAVGNDMDYSKIIANTTIKKIAITNSARWGALHLKYIYLKFKALESFDVTIALFSPELDDQYLDLCASIANYSVCIAIKNDDPIRNRVDNLVRRSIREEEKEEPRKIKEFQVDFDCVAPVYPDYQERDYMASNWRVKLDRTKKSKSIKLHWVKVEPEEDFADRDCLLDDIAIWLQLYSPTDVRLHNIELMAEHYEYLLSAQHLPEYANVAFARRRFAWLAMDKSWKLLDDAISAFKGRKGSTLSMGEMILCDEPSLPGFEGGNSASFSCVEIRKSIIYNKVLPTLSRRLKNVDTLMINSSWILADNDLYTLKIFLPSTRLRRIGIVFAPFHFDSQQESTSVDNKFLLEATSPEGNYILKIESSQGTFWSYRKGNKSIGKVPKSEHVNEGTESNFLIWIKCEHVEEFAITNNAQQKLVWEQAKN